jgi:hypothetical protein
MAKCAVCGKKGLFVSTNKNGVCNSCISLAKFDFNQRYRIISESQRIISESKSFKTVLSRIDTLIEHAQYIAKYEAWGMQLMTPLASALISSYSNKKIVLIKQFITDEIDNIRTKADIVISPKSKISENNKVLVKIAEWKKEFPGEEISAILEAEENTTHKIVWDLQLKTFLEEAEKAIFMDQKNKAITIFQEALYFIKTDEIPDDQQAEIIEDIKKRIAALK